jgi:hypothetical protein
MKAMRKHTVLESRERVLLKKVEYWYSYEFPEGELYTSIKEIRKLLAQPEQEQEPVAWMYEEATSFNKDGYFSEWLPCFYLEKADEDESLRNETPLYAAPPPKREPLSDTKCPYPEETSCEYRDGFTDGILYAEKHHAITGEN